MGQGLSKTAWPKAAGGYRTITGERKHSFLGLRPFLNNQDRDGHQRNDDCKQLELEDVQKENSLCMYVHIFGYVPFHSKLGCLGLEEKGTLRAI